jgi:hypothetical protein
VLAPADFDLVAVPEHEKVACIARARLTADDQVEVDSQAPPDPQSGIGAGGRGVGVGSFVLESAVAGDRRRV